MRAIAATIARAMGLNEDLVQAIAVGHDLGHAPFGHEGERVLRKFAEEKGLTFAHEIHSLRVVDKLDSPYAEHPGLNLTFAVRDGIACHCGEKFEQRLEPDWDKDPSTLLYMQRGKATPATLEGCVVRWADKVSYLGRDWEDAVELEILKDKKLPAIVKNTLGESNREMIANVISDMVDNSSDKEIAVSSTVHDALNALYEFNMKNVYKSSTATASFSQIQRAATPLFELLCRLISQAQKKGSIKAIGADRLDGSSISAFRVLGKFLDDDVREWKAEDPSQLAIDFIAGMTDSFFRNTFDELFFPKGVA